MIVRAETARVFGNLSRRVEIRQCFQDDGQFVDILSDLDSAQTIRYIYLNFLKQLNINIHLGIPVINVANNNFILYY